MRLLVAGKPDAVVPDGEGVLQSAMEGWRSFFAPFSSSDGEAELAGVPDRLRFRNCLTPAAMAILANPSKFKDEHLNPALLVHNIYNVTVVYRDVCRLPSPDAKVSRAKDVLPSLPGSMTKEGRLAQSSYCQ